MRRALLNAGSAISLDSRIGGGNSRAGFLTLPVNNYSADGGQNLIPNFLSHLHGVDLLTSPRASCLQPDAICVVYHNVKRQMSV